MNRATEEKLRLLAMKFIVEAMGAVARESLAKQDVATKMGVAQARARVVADQRASDVDRAFRRAVDAYVAFAHTVRSERRRLGLSQAELATAAAASQSAVSRFERVGTEGIDATKHAFANFETRIVDALNRVERTVDDGVTRE